MLSPRNQKLTLLAIIHIFLSVFVGNTYGEIEETEVVKKGKQLTKRHFRVVWAQAIETAKADPFVNHTEYRLMGYDSKDGKGIRQIHEKLDSYRRPLLTSDGETIVWTSVVEGKCWAMTWEGKKRRFLTKGYAVDTWYDSEKKEEIVYIAQQTLDDQNNSIRDLDKFHLSTPDKKSPVWNTSDLALDNFQLARNGKTFAGLFPWPDGGIGNLKTKRWQKFNRGCWPSISPDDSSLFWIFEGKHMNLVFLSEEHEKKWEVPINNVKGLKDHEMYHPRWSNSPEFFVMTGPYKDSKGVANAIFGDATSVEIYVGVFNEKMDRVETFFQVTENKLGDFYPDLWVKKGEKENLNLEKITKDKKKGLPAYKTSLADWPPEKTTPLIVWDNANVNNEATYKKETVTTKIALKNQARYGSNWELNLGGGYAQLDQVSATRVAQALRDEKKLTLECVVNTAIYGFEKARPILTVGTKSKGDLFQILQIPQKKSDEASVVSIRVIKKDGTLTEREGEAWLEWRKPLLITLTLEDNKFQIYRNGTPASGEMLGFDPTQIPNDLSDAYVIFGDKKKGQWEGKIEKFALYPQVFDEYLVDASSDVIAKAVKERPIIFSIDFTGKLIEATKVPDPKSIAPYQRALVAHRYKVVEIHNDGKFSEEEIVVLHYALMDEKKLNSYPRVVGQNYRMEVESFDDNKQLGPERRTVFEEHFGDLWYDASTPQD